MIDPIRSQRDISVSVVVPVLEEPLVLDLFLMSLNSTLPDAVQLILVDDGCTSDARAVLGRWARILDERLDVEVIRHDHPIGDGPSFNVGLERCSGDVVVRLDSDTVFTDPWLEPLMEHFRSSPTTGIVSGVLLYPSSGGINHAGITFYQFVGRHAHLNARPSVLPTQAYRVQSMALGFAAMNRRLVESVGGFDGLYRSGYDDLDMALRIGEKGADLLVQTRATAFHWERSAGPHRDSSRKRNLAVFWHRWGAKIKDDLWSFTTPQFETNSSDADQGGSVFLGVDLLSDRVGAERFWQDLTERTDADVADVLPLSHRCPGEGAIALPLVLGAEGHKDARRFLILADNFVRLRGNAYFHERRRRVRDDDLVADLHGNVIPLRDLAVSAWPGEKIR